MVQSVQSTAYYPAYYPAAGASVAPMSAPTAQQQTYGADAYQTSAPANGFDPNKQAGGAKRFFNGVGNAFGRVADWVGLGTISHYAKENFQLYDANKSNDLDGPEFNAVSSLIQKSFQEVDSNANQRISLGEFKKVIGALVDANFRAADTSGDGFLNYAEANAAGYVRVQGSHDSFMANDRNMDQLLSRNEFAGLLNDTKLKGR